MRRTRLTAAAAAMSSLAFTAWALLLGGGVSSAETVPADIVGYEYAPGDVTVATGDTITWTNSDTAPHTVTSTSGSVLDSPTMQQGDTWSFTFTLPGSYPYYCAIHPDMKGSVTVTGAAARPRRWAVTPWRSRPRRSPAPRRRPRRPATTVPARDTGSGVIAPFWVHFQKAHLETSPGQQVAEALDVDQYTKTHTVLVADMLRPLLDFSGPNVLAPFWVHFQKAHLETSPGQQVAEALALDQYVKTHTVLVEDMLAPVMGG